MRWIVRESILGEGGLWGGGGGGERESEGVIGDAMDCDRERWDRGRARCVGELEGRVGAKGSEGELRRARESEGERGNAG